MQQRSTFLLSLLTVIVFSSCGIVVFDGRITKEKLLSNTDFQWQKDSSDRFIYYYEQGSWAERNIDSIKYDAEKSINHCLYLVKKTAYPRVISYFVVEDRRRMDALIYTKTNGQAFPSQNVVCAIASESTKALGSHEIFHIVSRNVFGSTQNWISEGMAVYSSNAWWKQDLHTLSNYFRNKGKLIPLKDLVTNFRLFDDRISYPQAGSLLKYLYEKYGIEQIIILWTQGIGVFCANNGIKLEAIERDWISSISKYDIERVNYILPN